MKSKVLGSLEIRVMNYFWKVNVPITISDVHKHLNKSDTLAYTTVSTIVTRLLNKKLLVRRKSGRIFTYQSKISKAGLEESYIKRAIKNLVGGFGDVAIAGFIEELKDNPDAIRIIKELKDAR